MKKLMIFLILVFCGIQVSHAQKLNFGIKGGLNLATLGGDLSDGSKMMTNFHVGVYGKLKATKVAIQPEIQYSVQGSAPEGDGDNLNLNYLNIPVMLKLYLAAGFHLEAGPQLGFLLSAKSGDTDMKEAFKSSAVGANVGAGVDLPFGLNVGARYYFGLGNILENYEFGPITVGGESSNQVFQVSLGYDLK